MNLIPLIFYSQRIPCFEAHWKEETTDSLISFMYWTPFVISTTMFGPTFSGPKHQILVVSSFYHSNYSTNLLALAFGSWEALIYPFSIRSGKSSCNGWADPVILLCLFWDFVIACWLDAWVIVSLYVTTGSDLMIGTWA